MKKIITLVSLLLIPCASLADMFATMTAYDAEGLESDFSAEVELPNTCAPHTLSWTAPTKRTNGTALTNLAGFKVYYGPSSREYDQEIDIPDPTLTTYLLDVPCAPPEPPGNLTVESGSLSAYAIDETRDFIALVHVGSVPAGTPCDGSQQVNGLYVVPRDAVDWIGRTSAEVVVARCSGF